MLEVEEQLRRYGAALEAELLRQSEAPIADAPVLDVPVIEVPRPRRRRRALLVGGAVLVVIAIVVAVVVRLDGDHKRSRVVSQPPSEGVFAEKTGAILLTSDGIDGVTAIDLDKRIAGRRVIDGERAGDQEYRITVTGGHVVVGWGEIYALPLSAGDSTKIADATIYIPAAEPGEVWTVTWEGERIGAGSATIRRVSMSGAVEFSSDSWDTGAAYPLLGIPGGLVVQTPEGIALWDAQTGTTGPILGPGPTASIASDGRSLAWCANTCSDLHVVTLTHTGPPTAPHAGGQQLALSNDDHWLAYLRPLPDDRSELVLRDLTNGNESIVATELPQYGSIAWSTDSRQLFYSQTSYPQPTMLLGRYSPETRRWEQNEIPVGDAVGGLVVLSPSESRSFFSSTLVQPSACPGAGRIFPSGRHGVCSFRF